MFGRKKVQAEHENKELLIMMQAKKQEWMSIKRILDQSIDPSEKGQYDEAVAKSKYFYLLKEARERRINMN